MGGQWVCVHMDTTACKLGDQQCPSYATWYEELHAVSKDFDEDDHFRILCAIYHKLNATRACTFTDALAQTCWSMKEKKGSVDLR